MSRWKKSNPVEAAIQRANVKRMEANYASESLTVRLMILEAEQGQDATELLARLAVVIGYPCEAAAQVYGEQMLVQGIAVRRSASAASSHPHRLCA